MTSYIIYHICVRLLRFARSTPKGNSRASTSGTSKSDSSHAFFILILEQERSSLIKPHFCMSKQIILHDVETGREVRVNALTLKIETVVIAGDWNECASATISEPSTASLINGLNNLTWTPIRWIEEDGKEQFARVIEHPNVINEKRKNLI